MKKLLNLFFAILIAFGANIVSANASSISTLPGKHKNRITHNKATKGAKHGYYDATHNKATKATRINGGNRKYKHRDDM